MSSGYTDILPHLAKAAEDVAALSNKMLDGSKTFGALTADDVQIGPTPKDEVWRRDKVVLYRYRPVTERRVAEPLLIAFSVVGRYTIVDLQEDRSVVRAFLERGIDVYVIDWGTASRADRWLDVDDYVNDYIGGAVEAIRAREDGRKVNLLGVCEGGTFSLCYAALRPETLQSLILVVTPIDFHGKDPDEPAGHGFINVWARNIPPAELDRFIEARGNMPGELMGHVFANLTPMRTLLKYNLDLMEIAGDQDKMMNFLRMEKWIADRPAHPGGVIKQWLKDLYQDNKLVKGEFVLGDRTVDLKNVTMPVLNVYAKGDHIVPPAMTRGVGPLLGSADYREEGVAAGHMGILVSGKAPRIMGSLLSEWLSPRDEAEAGAKHP